MSNPVVNSARTPLVTSTSELPTNSRGYGTMGESDEESIDSMDLSGVSYRKLIRQYVIIVPLCTLVTFVIVILTLHLLFPNPKPGASGALASLFLPFVAAGVAWTASHAVKPSLWATVASLIPWMSDLLSSIIHILLAESLRLGTLLLLRSSYHFPPNEPSRFFHAVYWNALGWAAAEVVVSVYQGYQHLALYQELFGEPATYLTDQVEVQSPTQMRGSDFLQFAPPRSNPDAGAGNSSMIISIPQLIEEQLDNLAQVKYLTELEDIYGVPVPDIPIFIMALQRIDSILLSLGLTLIISSSLVVPSSTSRIAFTYMVTVLIHTPLSILWTPRALPQLGVPTASYIAFMASIGCIWVGLWQWGFVD